MLQYSEIYSPLSLLPKIIMMIWLFYKNIFMLYDILIFCHLKNSWISSQVNSSTTSNFYYYVFNKHCCFYIRQTNSAIFCGTCKCNEMQSNVKQHIKQRAILCGIFYSLRNKPGVSKYTRFLTVVNVCRLKLRHFSQVTNGKMTFTNRRHCYFSVLPLPISAPTH